MNKKNKNILEFLKGNRLKGKYISFWYQRLNKFGVTFLNVYSAVYRGD